MSSPVIEISNLTKYYGKTRGIENVSLEVREGEIFGFIGPNGAGKSTTIRVLLNLIFPSSGTASIMGMDVTRDSKKIKQLTGYVPSDANAYTHMRVSEFLLYCMRFYNNSDAGRIEEMAEVFDLDLNRNIRDLSMGNRKKVSIMQALIHRPPLLILDEPTTGLDPLIQSRFFDLLVSENKRGMTIFFSSHILSEIQAFCKRVAIIRDGSIINVEEIETLRRRQLKRITVVFVKAEDAALFSIKGTERTDPVNGKTLSFMYSGRMNELVTSLAGYPIDDMTAEEPSLEEIFMHYYKQPGNE